MIPTHIQYFCHPLSTAGESAILEDPPNTEDSGKIIGPTPLPDNAQQWMLEDFKATEISNSWKHFLVAPEPHPEPDIPAEAVMKVAPPTPTEAEDSVAEAQDLIVEEVHPETVSLDGASEAKEYGETAEVSTMLEEGPVSVVEEVTSAFTSEDAFSADEALSSEAALVQEVEESASPACECSAAEAPALVSAAAHESSASGKIELFFPCFLNSIKNLHGENLCFVLSCWQCNILEAGLLNVKHFL